MAAGSDEYGLAFGAAVLVAIASTPFVSALASRLRIVAMPSTRGIHHTPTPLLGGLAVLAGALSGTFASGLLPSNSPRLIWAVLGITAIAGVGVLDDRRPLRWQTKLCCQVACAAAYVVAVEPLPAAGVLAPWVAGLWIVLLTNALNLIDNSNGLASGTAALCAVALGALAASSEQADVARLGFAVAGGSIGFFFRNFPRGTIFLGDTGSMALGFALAVLSIEVMNGRPLTSNAAPLLVLAYPLFDLAYVTVGRTARGRSIFIGGTDHSLHALARRMGTVQGAVLTLLLASAALAGVAILLDDGLETHDLTRAEEDSEDRLQRHRRRTGPR